MDRGSGRLGGARQGLAPRPATGTRAGSAPRWLGPQCSRPASVIGNRWMGGGRRPALPPVAIPAGAGRGREGGERGWLGPRGRQHELLPSAARACPGAGLGLAEARAGTGRGKLKPAARRLGGRLGGGGVLVCLPVEKYESCRSEGFQRRLYEETRGHRSIAESCGRTRGQSPGRWSTRRSGSPREVCGSHQALPGDAGGAGVGVGVGWGWGAPSSRAALANGGGGAESGDREA